MGSHTKHRQNEEKIPETTGKRQRKQDTETGKTGMGAILEGGRD
jgi:hypothetical protein